MSVESFKDVRLTTVQRDVLDKLLTAGEAIRAGTAGYRANGFMISDERVMRLLAQKGAARIETVGESTFAIATERGRAMLNNYAPRHETAARRRSSPSGGENGKAGESVSTATMYGTTANASRTAG